MGIDSLVTMTTELPLSNLPAYHEGEMWHSYLNRVAFANGFSSAMEMFAVTTDSPAKWKNQYLNYDCSKPIARTILKTGEDWILTGTTFKGMAPLMDRLNATRRISLYNTNSSMNSKLVTPMPAFIQELRICPECRQLEGDGWYFHTELQMPGVRICPKHGCALSVYTGTPFMEHYEDSFTTQEPSPFDEIMSPFDVDFFNASLDCDVTGIMKYITAKAYDMGIGKFSRGDKETPWPEAGLCKRFLPSISTIREANPNRMPPEMLFPLLAYLSNGNVEDILQQTKDTSKDIALETAISKEYKIKSPFRRDFLIVECLDCGFTFPTTPLALKIGWGCPVCNDLTSETDQFARMVSVHSKGRHVHTGVFCGWNAPFSYIQKDGGEKKTVFPEDYFAKDFTFTEFDNYSTEVAALGSFRLASYRIIKGQPLFTIVHTDCGKAFESFRTNFCISPNCRICNARPTAEQTFLSKLNMHSKNFHVIGTYTKDHVTISDGTMSFEGKPNTVLSRLGKHLNPTKKSTHENEYRLIDRRLSELKGTIISLDDLEGITDKRTVSNYVNRLCSKGKLKRLAIGLTCHPDEDYTIVDIQQKHILCKENDGCAICDSALFLFGEKVENPRFAYAINFNRNGDNHCFIGGKSYGKPTVFLLQIPVNKENIYDMTFVASVWHREMLSNPDKDESLLKILRHCIQAGASKETILEIGDLFPTETGLEVRRLIRRFNEQSK